MVGNYWRGVASASARQARAAATAAAAAATTAACAAPLHDGLHHGMRLLKRFVLMICRYTPISRSISILINNNSPGRFRSRRLFSMETSQVRRRCYSAQVCAQTQMHSLFLRFHRSMGLQSDTTGKRSGAGPTTLQAIRDPVSRYHTINFHIKTFHSPGCY